VTGTTTEQAAWEEGHRSHQAQSSAIRLPLRETEKQESRSHVVIPVDDGHRDIAAVVYRRKSHLRTMLNRMKQDRLKMVVRAEQDLRYLLT